MPLKSPFQYNSDTYLVSARPMPRFTIPANPATVCTKATIAKSSAPRRCTMYGVETNVSASKKPCPPKFRTVLAKKRRVTLLFEIVLSGCIYELTKRKLVESSGGYGVEG